MDTPKVATLSGAIEDMISAYQEANSAIDIYDKDPSIEVYSKHINKNRPFVVCGGCSNWAASSWNVEYLLSRMSRKTVKIAETPVGNADSVVTRPEDGIEYFVRPWEKEEKFDEFMSFLQVAAISSSGTHQSVKYSQGQNDNLHSEYLPLLPDVPRDISKVTGILGSKPDAVNIWIGNNLSVTAMHRDPYENIYAQIKGAKNFILIPPVETACVNEQFIPCAEYAGPPNWSIRPDNPESKVPVPLWDPDKSDEKCTEFSRLSKPYRVCLREGDLLYLPAYWYHKVSQENSKEGICCSVNYWYDMDYTGFFHSATTYIRNMAWTATERGIS